jgi:hypothetical protein
MCPSTACGGDITGVWLMDEECYPATPPLPVMNLWEEECPDSEFTGGSSKDRGRQIFNADGTYQRVYDYMLTWNLTLPTHCL